MSNKSILLKMPLLDYKVSSSVCFNGVWLQIDLLSKYVSEFCNPVWLATGSKDWEVHTRGSATFVKFRKRYFAVLTKHQIENEDFSNVGFRGSNGNHYVVGGVFRNSNSDHEHASQLFFIELGEAVKNGSIEENRFLNLNESQTPNEGEKITCGFSFGYAYQDQKWEVDEEGSNNFGLTHIGTVIREVTLHYKGESFDDTMCKWERTIEEEFNPDGFSGGPTFAIVNKGDEGFMCFLTGVNLTSNGKIFHTIKVDSVIRYLKAIVSN